LLDKITKNVDENIYVLIDEPEKFCHPILFNKLSKYINLISKKVNLFISSHSPEFISKLYSFDIRPKTIFFQNKYSGTNNMIEIDQNIFQQKDDQKFRSILLKNEIYRIDFLHNIFVKKIIIVEDNSTKILIQNILNVNRCFDSSVNIYVCHGKQ
jgi:predicted ATP-dependent endonuclease of OLD family